MRQDPSTVRRPCSLEYLLVLSEDLLKISSAISLWPILPHSRAADRRILKTILEEIARIYRNPILIPIAEIREDFWSMVVPIIRGWPSFREVMKEARNRRHAPLVDHLHFNRAHQDLQMRGVFDFRRTLWQQFLHHMAPGMGGEYRLLMLLT